MRRHLRIQSAGRKPVKWCERCGHLIQPGEEYTSHDKTSSSAGGITVHVHVVCPEE
jgi:hypothetical protein